MPKKKEEPKKKVINGRKKGHSFELKLVAEWKEMGYGECCSSRSESKRKDDAGIDLCYTDPFYIQAKAVEQSMNTHAILAKMPDHKGFTRLLFHKRNRQGEVVSMYKEDFYKLLKMIK